MDAITDAIAKIGTRWNAGIAAEMAGLHEPLHAARAASYESSVQSEKALKYGPHPRHRIDVYGPKKRVGPLPVVVYFHGGGYTRGDNDFTPHMYGNIANYFASNGCIGCLATYRLMPDAKYPNGPDDVAAALRWVQENIATYGGDPETVVAVGHSAGGAHLASSIFLGKVLSQDTNIPLLRGAVFLSAALTFDLNMEERQVALESYFDTKNRAEIQSMNSVGHFTNMTAELPCDILMLITEYDYGEIEEGNVEFFSAYRKKFDKFPILQVIKGHNHISNVFSIGLEGDETGARILRYVRTF